MSLSCAKPLVRHHGWVWEFTVPWHVIMLAVRTKWSGKMELPSLIGELPIPSVQVIEVKIASGCLMEILMIETVARYWLTFVNLIVQIQTQSSNKVTSTHNDINWNDIHSFPPAACTPPTGYTKVGSKFYRYETTSLLHVGAYGACALDNAVLAMPKDKILLSNIRIITPHGKVENHVKFGSLACNKCYFNVILDRRFYIGLYNEGKVTCDDAACQGLATMADGSTDFDASMNRVAWNGQRCSEIKDNVSNT